VHANEQGLLFVPLVSASMQGTFSSLFLDFLVGDGGLTALTCLFTMKDDGRHEM